MIASCTLPLSHALVLAKISCEDSADTNPMSPFAHTFDCDHADLSVPTRQSGYLPDPQPLERVSAAGAPGEPEPDLDDRQPTLLAHFERLYTENEPLVFRAASLAGSLRVAVMIHDSNNIEVGDVNTSPVKS